MASRPSGKRTKSTTRHQAKASPRAAFEPLTPPHERSDKARTNLMLAAASLMALSTLLHAFAGGREVYAPTRASGLDPLVVGVLSVVWHAVTVLLAAMAGALSWAAYHPNPPLELFVGCVIVGFAAFFLGYGVVDFQNVSSMPQWTLFVATLALMLSARRATAKSSTRMG